MTERPKLLSACTESTFFIFEEATADAVEKQIQAAMNRGEALFHKDGRREWISEEVIFDSSKDASEAFTWNRAGTKVKHEKVRHILDPKTKQVVREVIGTVFREF